MKIGSAKPSLARPLLLMSAPLLQIRAFVSLAAKAGARVTCGVRAEHITRVYEKHASRCLEVRPLARPCQSATNLLGEEGVCI